MSRHAAIDLGASGGRVVVAEVDRRGIALQEVHRFSNGPVTLPDGLHWDVLGLYRAALEGLQKAKHLDTVGVDSWAVDYGLLGASGALLGNPWHYRDNRTAAVIDAVHAKLPGLYRINGLQFLPFNTIYQLAAEKQLEKARSVLLVPDLVSYWLTGSIGAEVTNASTTGLLDVQSHQWSVPSIEALGFKASLFPPLRQPGEVIGPLRREVREEIGLVASVVAVGSHDTASAVVGVPMEGDQAAYISLGTWGLVGVELEKPVLTADSQAANFTNELGVDGRVRYLRNVMGLWLLQELLRTWGLSSDQLPTLLAEAAVVPKQPVFDVNDPRLLAPGNMPRRLAVVLEEAGFRTPRRRAHLVRCVLDSLAAALASTVRDAARLSGRELSVVHVVGGGSQHSLLCQLISDACGLPVVAGPVDATALGNLLVQARSHGTIKGDLDSLRALIRSSHQLVRHEPRP